MHKINCFYPILSYFVVFVNTISYFCYNNYGDCMKPLKEKISITIDSDVLEKAREAAENDDRSLSQYINMVLKNHIKNISDNK